MIKKTILRILGVILLVAVVLIGVLTLWVVKLMPGIDSVSETPFDLPGYEEKWFDRQTIAYDEETSSFFFSGYMINRDTCPLFIRSSDGSVKRVGLLRSDGSVLNTHAGGIAIAGKYVYLAGSVDDCLYVFDRKELLDAPDGGSVNSVGSFATAVSDEDGLKPSFLTVDDGKLYVGEFHLPILPMFHLRSNHRIGDTEALMTAFTIDPENELGLTEIPCEACCLPDMVQGIVVRGDKVYLNRSFFLIPAKITSCTKSPAGSMKLMGADVPLYTLNEGKSIMMVPFGEEIELVDGKLYMSAESTMLPSVYYKIWNGRKCRAIPIENID